MEGSDNKVEKWRNQLGIVKKHKSHYWQNVLDSVEYYL